MTQLRPLLFSLTSALLASAIAIGCGSDEGTSSAEHGTGGSGQAGANGACTPGDTQSCRGISGGKVCDGVQSCATDGSRWLTCDCGDTSGTGGNSTGGSGGTASGGMGGDASGGTASGGTGGDASGGTGGTGGTTSCTAGKFSCDGANLQKCDGGSWAFQEECRSPDHCDQTNGSCIPCLTGEHDCNGAELMVCKANHSGFEHADDCASAVLCYAVSGTCGAPACAANEYSCSGATLSKCNTYRTGFDDVAECQTASDCREAKGRCACPKGSVTGSVGTLSDFSTGMTNWTSLATAGNNNVSLQVVSSALVYADTDGSVAGAYSAAIFTPSGGSACFDASSATGITLKVTSKNAGTAAFALALPETILDSVGGVCTGADCNNHFQQLETFTAGQTKTVTLKFSTLKQSAGGTLTFDADRIRALLVVPVGASLGASVPAFQYTIDDVALY